MLGALEADVKADCLARERAEQDGTMEHVAKPKNAPGTIRDCNECMQLANLSLLDASKHQLNMDDACSRGRRVEANAKARARPR